METFSALQAISAGNSPVTVEFPSQKDSDTELWWFIWSGHWWVDSMVTFSHEEPVMQKKFPYYDVIVSNN